MLHINNVELEYSLRFSGTWKCRTSKNLIPHRISNWIFPMIVKMIFFYNLIKNLICFLGMNGWIVLYCLTTVYTIMSQNYPHKLTREMFMSDYREREKVFLLVLMPASEKMWWQWKKVFVGLVRCWEEVRDDDKNKMKKWVTKSHVLEFHLPSSLAML